MQEMEGRFGQRTATLTSLTQMHSIDTTIESLRSPLVVAVSLDVADRLGTQKFRSLD